MERLNLMVVVCETFYFHKIEAYHLVLVHWNSPSVSRDTFHASSCCGKLPSDFSEPKAVGLCRFNSEHSNCLQIKGKSDATSSKKSSNYRDLLKKLELEIFIHTDIWETISVLLSEANLWMTETILYKLFILDNAFSLVLCIKNLHNLYIAQVKSYLPSLQRVFCLHACLKGRC